VLASVVQGDAVNCNNAFYKQLLHPRSELDALVLRRPGSVGSKCECVSQGSELNSTITANDDHPMTIGSSGTSTLGKRSTGSEAVEEMDGNGRVDMVGESLSAENEPPTRRSHSFSSRSSPYDSEREMLDCMRQTLHGEHADDTLSESDHSGK